ncbi:MAG: hypothetical protein GY940_15420, partial [bacterium]|nr:hypothetical protein [bacterium]
SDGIRQAMNGPNAIRLSPLEAKAYISHLGKELAMLISSHPTFQQPMDAAIAALNAPISRHDVVGRFPVDINNRLEYWDGTDKLHQEVRDVLKIVIDSYANALDAVMSFHTAAGPAVAPGQGATPGSGPAPVRRSDFQNLYSRWAVNFWQLVLHQSRRRQALDNNLLVLRLVPRSGRYGETPQRTQEDELKQEPKNSIWPGHPTRRTEGYVLEPVPKVYYTSHHPTVYMREDYKLSLLSRGYGIGANLYSVSLLPEEKQTIVVKSFKDTSFKITESTAENVFEEAGSETSNDFGEEMYRENQQESTNADSFNISAKASGSFGFASGSVESGYNAQSGAREFAKNTGNVTSRLASKLSSKRTVTVETMRTGERKEELHTEISTERKIHNPNLGHTVSFHWFQMTRKYLQELELEDIKMVYSSGKHNIARIMVSGGKVPASVRNLPSFDAKVENELVSRLPPDIAQRLPPNSAVVIVTEPYTEVVNMGSANAFLGNVFTRQKAVEINSVIWQLQGSFDAAPDGLGVTAFPGNRHNEVDPNGFVPLFNPDPTQTGPVNGTLHVAADRVELRPRDAAGPAEVFYLPNLDPRYRIRDGQVPARFTAEPHETLCLPRLMSVEERIVNTNGVYCDAMVGQCSALEDYLQRHRELDLREKKIEVGHQELDFKWALAKDNMMEVVQGADQTLSAIVKPREAQVPFETRLQVEAAQQAEQSAIAQQQFERRKLEKQLALLDEQVNELQRKIQLMGTPPSVSIDAPENSNVSVNVDVDMDGNDEDPPGGGSVTVE